MFTDHHCWKLINCLFRNVRLLVYGEFPEINPVYDIKDGKYCGKEDPAGDVQIGGVDQALVLRLRGLLRLLFGLWFQVYIAKLVHDELKTDRKFTHNPLYKSTYLHLEVNLIALKYFGTMRFAYIPLFSIRLAFSTMSQTHCYVIAVLLLLNATNFSYTENAQ